MAFSVSLKDVTEIAKISSIVSVIITKNTMIPYLSTQNHRDNFRYTF